tara:strand:- start:60 stop:365 length:306 start_codon:yes stop_codon:yes gene_type:complete
MTKKLIVNALTNTSEEVNLTFEEQTAYDNKVTAWNNGALDRALKDLRDKRNQLLAETDYLALPDVVMSEDMTTYRQALRDLTNGLTTVEQVEAIIWPTKPV